MRRIRLESEAAGSTGQKKNLNPRKERLFWKNGESKETMKESVIAYLDMRQQNFLQQNQEKKIMSIM